MVNPTNNNNLNITINDFKNVSSREEALQLIMMATSDVALKALDQLPVSLQHDKEICKAIVSRQRDISWWYVQCGSTQDFNSTKQSERFHEKISKEIIKRLPFEFQNDKEIIVELLLKLSSGLIIDFMKTLPNEIKNDKYIIIELIKNHDFNNMIRFYKELPETFKTDTGIFAETKRRVLEVLKLKDKEIEKKESGVKLAYARVFFLGLPAEFLTDPEIISERLNLDPTFNTQKKTILQLFKEVSNKHKDIIMDIYTALPDLFQKDEQITEIAFMKAGIITEVNEHSTSKESNENSDSDSDSDDEGCVIQ